MRLPSRYALFQPSGGQVISSMTIVSCERVAPALGVYGGRCGGWKWSGERTRRMGGAERGAERPEEGESREVEG